MTIVYIVVGIVALFVLLRVLGGHVSACPDLPPNATDDDLRDLARRGRKIEAIKWYRVLHRVGLKEAKDAVEQMK